METDGVERVRRALDILSRDSPAPLAPWLRGGVALAILLAVLLVVVARLSTGAPQETQRLLGAPAPAFALPAERGGHLLPGTVSLESRRGHPVLIVFFYTLCAHCLNEVQAAQAATSAAATQGAEVLYVDSPAERPDIADAYLARLNVQAPALLDAGEQVAARYGVSFYPAAVLVDAGGVVRRTWTGETGAGTLLAGIRALSG